MKIIQTRAANAKLEFVELGVQIIKEAIPQFFNQHPGVHAISFQLDSVFYGHEYEESFRLWNFKAKLEPNLPGMGNDLDNYVEVAMLDTRTPIRDGVGSLASIFRDLRQSTLKMFGTGFVVIKREDWVDHVQMEIPYC